MLFCITNAHCFYSDLDFFVLKADIYTCSEVVKISFMHIVIKDYWSKMSLK